MMSLLLVLPASSCATLGNFADIAEPLCLEDKASARWLLENGERGFLVGLNIHNEIAGGC
jgi:hypothetical protein